MGTVILLRHARSEANNSGVLAGRTPNVGLDATGRDQAAALVERLAGVELAGLVHSPLLRCEQTVEPLARARGIPPIVDDALCEVDYGDWTGRELGALQQEELWQAIQSRPSAVRFPSGERLSHVQHRAVEAVRGYDSKFATADGSPPVWLLCSHGDVIKSILADALGQHLDLFQRLVVDPASISIVRYTELRPFVLRLNDSGDGLGAVLPTRGTGGTDATVGGGAGPTDTGQE
ncbi:MSMEG_4193 family putative phosphomutase [Haloechinothrix sp. LS1_15]|uniref:MSMEG_4193 family putative phosphomutase n=1 Tax=Haloechinothrix sp. LS1_15 TaxID=2652248 RepID=UPI002945BA5E|nr:MSMEG_4193 family putative phosphomutase [Haloechinothrix sp. LS1_15]MDV6014040.1 MSMEG_4193 family putative phosphomutase [Haloechinothrix sp. LS1_15]